MMQEKNQEHFFFICEMRERSLEKNGFGGVGGRAEECALFDRERMHLLKKKKSKSIL